MRIKCGQCRMPIGMCSEYRDKDCGKFCYYNTVEIKTNIDQIRDMTDNKEVSYDLANIRSPSKS